MNFFFLCIRHYQWGTWVIHTKKNKLKKSIQKTQKKCRLCPLDAFFFFIFFDMDDSSFLLLVVSTVSKIFLPHLIVHQLAWLRQNILSHSILVIFNFQSQVIDFIYFSRHFTSLRFIFSLDVSFNFGFINSIFNKVFDIS